MSNPTTPFGWQMPTNTDLVTDLPADFEVFGQAVATSMADLLGGTTGQMLTKNSNADMDFTWVSANPGDITGVTAGTGISGGGTSGDVTITNSMATAIDAKGDLIAGTAADAFSRLAVGTNGQVLTADSATATGLKWATAGGGGKVLQVVQGTTTTSTTVASTSYTDTGLSASITPSSATSKILVMVAQKYILARTAAPTDAGLQIIRGATSIVDYGLRSAHIYATPLSSELQSATIWSPIYLDSPSTTSATTYKTQAKLSDTGSSHSITFQQYSGTAVMILMEIGA